MLQHSTLIKYTVFILLLSQIWVNGVSYCHWMMNPESELIELVKEVEDSETEKEEEQKEKDKTFEMKENIKLSSMYLSSIGFVYLQDRNSIHPLEITTPPPELFLS